MAEKAKTRYLRMRADGFVYVWTAVLAAKKEEFDECDASGNLVSKPPPVEEVKTDVSETIQAPAVEPAKTANRKMGRPPKHNPAEGSVTKVNPADLPKK